MPNAAFELFSSPPSSHYELMLTVIEGRSSRFALACTRSFVERYAPDPRPWIQAVDCGWQNCTRVMPSVNKQSERPARGIQIAAAILQYCGWLLILVAIVLVLLVGSVNVTPFRYNGF